MNVSHTGSVLKKDSCTYTSREVRSSQWTSRCEHKSFRPEPPVFTRTCTERLFVSGEILTGEDEGRGGTLPVAAKGKFLSDTFIRPSAASLTHTKKISLERGIVFLIAVDCPFAESGLPNVSQHLIAINVQSHNISQAEMRAVCGVKTLPP